MHAAIKHHLAKIGYDDYEEAELLGQLDILVSRGDARLISPATTKKMKLDAEGLEPEEAALKAQLIKTLGFNPFTEPRPTRVRGRPRDDALPKPLPPAGTQLTTPLGDVYTVQGYAFSARSQRPATILYLFNGNLIARNIVNLLVGTLPNGVPLVTWEGDTRGLKAGHVVPLGRRRTITKKELLNDEHADPDRGWRPSDGPRGRGAY